MQSFAPQTYFSFASGCANKLEWFRSVNDVHLLFNVVQSIVPKQAKSAGLAAIVSTLLAHCIENVASHSQTRFVLLDICRIKILFGLSIAPIGVW